MVRSYRVQTPTKLGNNSHTMDHKSHAMDHNTHATDHNSHTMDPRYHLPRGGGVPEGHRTVVYIASNGIGK
jgi:hypothetical protein